MDYKEVICKKKILKVNFSIIFSTWFVENRFVKQLLADTVYIYTEICCEISEYIYSNIASKVIKNIKRIVKSVFLNFLINYFIFYC